MFTKKLTDLGSIPSISKDYRGSLRWSLEMKSSRLVVQLDSGARPFDSVLHPDSRRLGTCPQFEIPDSVIASDSISMMDGFALN